MSRRTKPTARPGRGRRKGRPAALWVVVGLVVALLAGGYVATTQWAGPAPTPGSPGAGAGSAEARPAGGPPALRVSPTRYDLGQVSQARGFLTVELAVSNAGGSDLIIREMETSCGCTQARLIVDGRSGPWFGMRGHGAWPTGWSARLQPGQGGTLRIQYDPDAHGIYRGPIDRIVVIYSNDPAQPSAQVRLTGTQVP